MTSRNHRSRLTVNAIAAAKPRDREYTLWDNLLAHFGVKVQPSGVRSFIVQTRAQGRMRKITLGRFPEMGIEKARREAAAVLARLWGGEAVASPRKTKTSLFRACANIVKNPRRPVARYLDRAELERLGAVLDRHGQEHSWPVAAIRLLTLTGARLSEVIDLKWDEIGEIAEDSASARLEDSKTGPRTLWIGPEAARLLAALPRSEDAARVFPEDLTSARLYTFWVGIREEAGLPGLRIHDYRHTRASQGVMNGVGLTTVGRAAARTPPARDHRHLCPSRRRCAARRRHAGGGRHRPRHGIQGRAAAPAGRGGGRRCFGCHA